MLSSQSIQNKCSECSEIIFEHKDKFTDQEFKTLLDNLKDVFEYTNQYKQAPQQASIHVCNCLRTVDNKYSSTCAFLGQYNNCFVRHNFNHSDLDMFDSLYKKIDLLFVSSSFPNREDIILQHNQQLKVIDFQKNPINRSNRITNTVKSLLEFNVFINQNNTVSAFYRNYKALIPLYMFHIIFKNYNIIKQNKNFNITVLNKCNEFLLQINNQSEWWVFLQNKLFGLNIKELFEGWSNHLKNTLNEHNNRILIRNQQQVQAPQQIQQEHQQGQQIQQVQVNKCQYKFVKGTKKGRQCKNKVCQHSTEHCNQHYYQLNKK